MSGLSIEPNSSRNSQGCGQEVKKGSAGAFPGGGVEGVGGGHYILFDPPPRPPQNEHLSGISAVGILVLVEFGRPNSAPKTEKR